MHFVDRIDRILFLRTVPLFGDLPQDRLATFAEHMNEVFLPEGTLFQREGEPVTHIRIVVEGGVEAFLPTGEAIAMPREAVLGVFESLAGASRQSIRTTRDTVLLEIPTGIVIGILEDYFDVVVHLFRGLTRILLYFIGSHGFDERLRDLATPPNPPKVSDDPDPVEQILILRNVVLFSRASVDGLAALCRTTRIVRFAEGETLWHARDTDTWGAVILSGFIVTSNPMMAANGPEVQEFRFGPLSPPGLIEMLAERPRWFDARAATDVTVLRIDLDDLYDTLEDHFDMTMECLGSFANAALTVFDRVGRARLAQIRPDMLSSEFDEAYFKRMNAAIRDDASSARLFDGSPESIRRR